MLATLFHSRCSFLESRGIIFRTALRSPISGNNVYTEPQLDALLLVCLKLNFARRYLSLAGVGQIIVTEPIDELRHSNRVRLEGL